MCFCSFSFPSYFVGTVSARWFRVLKTPSLFSSGWWQVFCTPQCWGVCLLHCVQHSLRRADCLLWHLPVWTWCYIHILYFVNFSDFDVLGVLFRNLSRHSMLCRCLARSTSVKNRLGCILRRAEWRAASGRLLKRVVQQPELETREWGFYKKKTLPVCRALRLIYLKCKPNISYCCSFTLKAFNWQNTGWPFILK